MSRVAAAILAASIVAGSLSACGKKGDPVLPEGVEDTMEFPGQYPAMEVPPPAAEPEAK